MPASRLAAAARALGVKCEVFVPTVSSPAKQARLRALGADVVVTGSVYAEALEACLLRQGETGALLTRPTTSPRWWPVRHAGVEIEEGRRAARQRAGERGRRRPDRAGVAAWFEGRSRVVALEPELAPTLYRAREAGAPVDVAVSGIAADSLGARRIGAIAWEVSQATCRRRCCWPTRRSAPPTRPVAGLQAGRGARGSPGTGGPADACLPAAGRRDRGAGAVRREPGSATLA